MPLLSSLYFALPCRTGKNAPPRLSSNHSEARSGMLTKSPAIKTASTLPTVSTTFCILAAAIGIS